MPLRKAFVASHLATDAQADARDDDCMNASRITYRPPGATFFLRHLHNSGGRTEKAVDSLVWLLQCTRFRVYDGLAASQSGKLFIAQKEGNVICMKKAE